LTVKAAALQLKVNTARELEAAAQAKDSARRKAAAQAKDSARGSRADPQAVEPDDEQEDKEPFDTSTTWESPLREFPVIKIPVPGQGGGGDVKAQVNRVTAPSLHDPTTYLDGLIGEMFSRMSPQELRAAWQFLSSMLELRLASVCAGTNSDWMVFERLVKRFQSTFGSTSDRAPLRPSHAFICENNKDKQEFIADMYELKTTGDIMFSDVRKLHNKR